MDSQKVDMFIMNNGGKLPSNQIPFLRERLIALDDSKWSALATVQLKDPVVSLILSLFLGGLGVDRFFIGHTGLGVGKLLTCGGLGIWSIIDWFLIMDATRDENLNMLRNYLV